MADISSLWRDAQKVVVDGEVELLNIVDGDISLSERVDGDANIVINIAPTVDTYVGEYEFVPTQSEQIISSGNKLLEHDIIIDPIPSNYGLITWNGTSLRVS